MISQHANRLELIFYGQVNPLVMSYENISWSIFMKEYYRTRQPRSPVERASDWATMAGASMLNFLGAVIIYSQTSIACKSLGSWKFVLDMGSFLNHSGLIIAPGEKANGVNLGMSFWSSKK